MAPSEQRDPGSASNADVGPLPPWFRRKLTVLGGTGPVKAETTSTLLANGAHDTPEKIPPWRDLQRKGAFVTPDDPETKRKTRDKMRFKVRRAQKRWREKQAKDTQLESKDDDDSEADADAVASMLLGSNDI
ncbi:hypothetical protein GSI_04017 [Ganoderma sinense ZZ0214-1]|uniref:Uncharacterized protein n=1 Tax=Ganoderma sinense ZZ0214-1 TaxID=1077348 RepID=A0A2G8SHZ7_9APHY|nr:hypothetical protein GSI_04017 [Ganoderma sinense ZZ0214-1]